MENSLYFFYFSESSDSQGYTIGESLTPHHHEYDSVIDISDIEYMYPYEGLITLFCWNGYGGAFNSHKANGGVPEPPSVTSGHKTLLFSMD